MFIPCLTRLCWDYILRDHVPENKNLEKQTRKYPNVSTIAHIAGGAASARNGEASIYIAIIYWNMLCSAAHVIT